MPIDEGLLQPCPLIPLIPVAEDGAAPLGTLLVEDVDLAGLYAECATGKDGLIEAIRSRQ